jgi:hypothetical protein
VLARSIRIEQEEFVFDSNRQAAPADRIVHRPCWNTKRNFGQ